MFVWESSKNLLFLGIIIFSSCFLVMSQIKCNGIYVWLEKILMKFNEARKMLTRGNCFKSFGIIECGELI